MTTWNFGEAFEAIARTQPERVAVVEGARELTWGALDRAAGRLLTHLRDAGLSPGAKVTVVAYNSIEYVVAFCAALRGGLTPFTTNYRYTANELTYLFDNADAQAVVFQAAFAPVLESVRRQAKQVHAWVAIPEGGVAAPEWASDYAAVVEAATQAAPRSTSADDELLLYTGGTTGLPKGVIWRQHDMIEILGAGADPRRGLRPCRDLSELTERLAAAETPRPRTLVACPLMHGAGQGAFLSALLGGGLVVLLPSRRLDGAELWSVAARHRVRRIAIVGQAFAEPMLAALRAQPDAWDLFALETITSTGAMWSLENKSALLELLPAGVEISDRLASSETPAMGASTSRRGDLAGTGAFATGPNCAVFDAAGRRVTPGSEDTGLLAVTGILPLGYYKDPLKTAETFRTFEGRRWSVPGDIASVNADGTVRLLGRGSQCINTGGEKVFPEEVEESLKRHPGVRDALVLGLPDPRFGQRVAAVVQLADETRRLTPEDLRAHVRAELAPYKAPWVLLFDVVQRYPNGKPDYSAARALLEANLEFKPQP